MILSSLSKAPLHEELTAQINKFTSILNEPVSLICIFCDGEVKSENCRSEEQKITVYAVEHVPIETKQGTMILSLTAEAGLYLTHIR